MDKVLSYNTWMFCHDVDIPTGNCKKCKDKFTCLTTIDKGKLKLKEWFYVQCEVGNLSTMKINQEPVPVCMREKINTLLKVEIKQ